MKDYEELSHEQLVQLLKDRDARRDGPCAGQIWTRGDDEHALFAVCDEGYLVSINLTDPVNDVVLATHQLDRYVRSFDLNLPEPLSDDRPTDLPVQTELTLHVDGPESPYSLEDGTLTVRQAARLLGLTVPTVTGRASSGRLPSTRIGRRICIHKTCLPNRVEGLASGFPKHLTRLETARFFSVSPAHVDNLQRVGVLKPGQDGLFDLGDLVGILRKIEVRYTPPVKKRVKSPEKKPSKKRFILVRQYAEERELSVSTVYRAIKAGRLDARYKDGLLHVATTTSTKD